MMATDHGVTGPINLGNPDETVGDLAERISALVDAGQPVVYEPCPPMTHDSVSPTSPEPGRP